MQIVARGGAASAALLFCALALSGCSNPNARCSSYLARGNRYLAAGNLQKAQVEFLNAMQVAPRRVDAQVMAGRLDERLGDFRGALALYQYALDVDPDYAPARANLARLYVFAGKPDRALQVIGPALRLHPDDPDLLAARAAARAGLKDPTEALADAERAVKLAPKNEDAVALLAALYGQSGEASRAVDLVRGALAARPDSSDLHRILADLYVRLRKDDLAEAELMKVVALNPKELEPRYRLASFYARSKREADAERTIEGAVAAHPGEDGPKFAYAAFLAAHRTSQDAERALEGFIAHDPADFDLQLARAALLEQESQTERALAAYQQVIAHATDRPQGLVARDRIAAMLFHQGRLEEASKLIAEVLARSARDTDALLLRADIDLERGLPEASITDLRAVLQEEPRSAPVLSALARAYVADAQMELAEESLRGALDAAPSNGAVRVQLAELLARTHRLDAGIALLNEAVRALPQDPAVHEALVRAYLQKPDLEAARKGADSMKEALPHESRGYYLAGAVAEAQKRLRDARGEYERALALRRDDLDALAALSRLDVTSGHTNDAISRVATLVTAEPANAAAHNLLGELRFASRDTRGALDQWTRCTQLAPRWWLPYHHLGAAEMASGDMPTALRTYEQGVAATHMAPPLVIDLAGLDERQGQPNDAIREYEALHREFPGMVVAANNLAMLLVTYRKDPASFEQARDLTTRFLSATNPDLLDTAGWVRLKSGDLSHALPVLEEAARRDPDSHVIRYHLGMAQLEAGQRDQARASLESALAGSARFEGSNDAHAALVRLGS